MENAEFWLNVTNVALALGVTVSVVVTVYSGIQQLLRRQHRGRS